MDYRVLVLEDNELLLETYGDFLSLKGCEVVLTSSVEKAYEERFDMYLLDVKFPTSSGFEFLKSLRDSGDITPAIFITSYDQKDKLKEGFEIGGKAYILKDHNFDKYIKADIKTHEFLKGKIVLGNFRYLLNMPATNREFVRVHPDIMASVELSCETDLVTHGKLFDLSLSGIGVVSEENNGIYAGAKIEIKFDLLINNKKESLRVDGEVLNILEYKDSYRYCIKIFPKSEKEIKIKKYVKLREAQILDSLDKEIDNYI